MTARGRFVAWLVACWVAGVSAIHASDQTRFYFEVAHLPGSDWCVGKYDVTQAQYEEITGENPSAFRDPRRPVDSVSWDDAEDFCTKLTLREHAAGRLPADFVYDLPTDAQWDQFAAGATLQDAVTSIQTTRKATEPVGTQVANPLGLYDALGNVWQWCRDWYNNEIRKKDTNKDMPYIPPDSNVPEEETFKVLRGGAWDTSAADGFTPASRLRYAPGMGNYRTGFRCVVERRK